MAFIEPFLSSLDKWIIDYPSKRDRPFIDFRRSLVLNGWTITPISKKKDSQQFEKKDSVSSSTIMRIGSIIFKHLLSDYNKVLPYLPRKISFYLHVSCSHKKGSSDLLQINKLKFKFNERTTLKNFYVFNDIVI